MNVFNNPEFGKVRTVEINGEPWLVGKDVALALGYSDTFGALKKHVDDEDKQNCQNDSFETPRGMTVINESGLYSLVLSSKLPGAKKFKHWVTSEVLPSIRKTGHYTAKPMTDYQMESIRVRKAQLLERLAKEYDGTYRQVLQAHATKELTGEYLLPLPYIGEKTYSAQEIGKKLGISANKVGMLANRNHLKTKQYGAWVNDVATERESANHRPLAVVSNLFLQFCISERFCNTRCAGQRQRVQAGFVDDSRMLLSADGVTNRYPIPLTLIFRVYRALRGLLYPSAAATSALHRTAEGTKRKTE